MSMRDLGDLFRLTIFDENPLYPLMTHLGKDSILDWKSCGIYDPASKRHVMLSVTSLNFD